MEKGNDIILKYFPDINPLQFSQLERLGLLLAEWNAKINLVSRKDIEHLYEKHILHSLAIAKLIQFRSGTRILDVGTGGGFPGLPLAIFFPEVSFTLVDSIGKKIMVVNNIIEALDIHNVTALHSRAEEIPGKYDFVTARAVTEINTFYGWVRNKFKKQQINSLPNGILYLKGGDLKEELKPFRSRAETFPIDTYFKEPYFDSKYIVYIESSLF